ncbi:MAG: sorbosone dehydrogenase [Gammaproteobacteria bacterium]|nr:sorbosone dehydrogenase [Gammaproteobacteria bacterium]
MRTLLSAAIAASLFAAGAQAGGHGGADDLPPIEVPDGFKATVFHPALGATRHIAVRDNGDVYIAREMRQANRLFGREASWGSLVALRDENGDGVADIVKSFGPTDVGDALRIHNGYLYFSSDQVVYRMALDDNLVPQSVAEPLAGGFPMTRSHGSKTLAFDNAGNMYVNSGVPTNNCESKRMAQESPGMDPCPFLERSGGIWKFADDETHQDQVRDGERYVTGTRNVVAMAWNPWADKLYFVMHGRDTLGMTWPDYYTREDNAELPAEEFHVAEAGDNFGWPFSYYDPRTNKRMQSPEYGGDGKTESTGDYKDPLIGFPAHWAPNDLLFHSGNGLPEKYEQGAFIVFHGSWNRMPFEQDGYNVVFVPMRDGQVTGEWELFIDGFEGPERVKNPGNAAYRPTGLAEGPDGAIYITEDKQGRVWKVSPTD